MFYIHTPGYLIDGHSATSESKIIGIYCKSVAIYVQTFNSDSSKKSEIPLG